MDQDNAGASSDPNSNLSMAFNKLHQDNILTIVINVGRYSNLGNYPAWLKLNYTTSDVNNDLTSIMNDVLCDGNKCKLTPWSMRTIRTYV